MNWGNKLLVTFVVFAAFMSYMLYRCLNTNYDLVTKDYYKDELAYQQVIDGANHANALKGQVSLSQQGSQIRLQMPADMNGKAPAGEVFFYCASDASRDRKIPLKADGTGQQWLDAATLAPGPYRVKITWTAAGVQYFSEEPFSVTRSH
jgi:hypothetical protein